MLRNKCREVQIPFYPVPPSGILTLLTEFGGICLISENYINNPEVNEDVLEKNKRAIYKHNKSSFTL